MVEYMHKNYVYDTDGNVIQVSGDDTYFSTLNYKPIKLTEEWLIMLGFEFDIFYQKHTNGNICIYYVNEVCLISWCKAHREDILRHYYPKYVHELQNLYYALTNTELTIK